MYLLLPQLPHAASVLDQNTRHRRRVGSVQIQGGAGAGGQRHLPK